MEAGGPPDEPRPQVCVAKRPREAGTHRSSRWGLKQGPQVPRESTSKASLRLMLLKQSPLFLEASYLFLYRTPFGESRDRHPSWGVRSPTPERSPVLERAERAANGGALALTSLQSANDIGILLAAEMWAGRWGSHGGTRGACSPPGEADMRGWDPELLCERQ